VLRTIQGATADSAEAAKIALDQTQRALALEPSSALALAIEGFVYGHLKKDVATARRGSARRAPSTRAKDSGGSSSR
jgi:hypothetical protein